MTSTPVPHDQHREELKNLYRAVSNQLDTTKSVYFRKLYSTALTLYSLAITNKEVADRQLNTNPEFGKILSDLQNVGQITTESAANILHDLKDEPGFDAHCETLKAITTANEMPAVKRIRDQVEILASQATKRGV
jgi:hypothetical protein